MISAGSPRQQNCAPCHSTTPPTCAPAPEQVGVTRYLFDGCSAGSSPRVLEVNVDSGGDALDELRRKLGKPPMAKPRQWP